MMESDGNSSCVPDLQLNRTIDDQGQLRRGKALEAFLQNPEQASFEFPDLKKELALFFSVSTNPYFDELGNQTAQLNCLLWEQAKEWASSQLASA